VPFVRQQLGFALYQAQIGQRHESAKILRSFSETRRSERDLLRCYVTQVGQRIYVLHAFQKKATSGIATNKREVDLIRQ
jgi:phage-related protein